MSRCDACGTTILFGGKRLGESRYCNEECFQEGVAFAKLAAAIPVDIVAKHVQVMHEGKCPKCSGNGPIDVHTWHYVLSVIVVTTWKSELEVCCQSCGKKANMKGIIISFFFGWWGIPFGLFVTPMQIFRNLIGIANPTDPSSPSPKLIRLATKNLVISADDEEQLSRKSLDDPN